MMMTTNMITVKREVNFIPNTSTHAVITSPSDPADKLELLEVLFAVTTTTGGGKSGFVKLIFCEKKALILNESNVKPDD